MAFIQLHHLRLPARVRSAGTSIANVNSVALISYAVAGGTGAPPVIAKLREATDKAKQKAEGDEATGAASSPLVFFIA